MQTIIFLNGDRPKPGIYQKYFSKKNFVIAADGAANFLKSINIIPNLIIGDLDSITANTQKFFLTKNVVIKKVTDQNYTDFEKCLQFCWQQKLDNITVFCAIGLRPDHTLNNYSILKRYAKKLKIKFITDEFEIFFIDKKTSFRYKPNETVSFLALPKAYKVNTSGLEFPLLDESLEFGVREGTLNKSISDKVSISFSKGNILMFKKHFI